jgi:hypothetical protein
VVTKYSYSHYGCDEGNLKVIKVVYPQRIGIPATFGQWTRKRIDSLSEQMATRHLFLRLPPL